MAVQTSVTPCQSSLAELKPISYPEPEPEPGDQHQLDLTPLDTNTANFCQLQGYMEAETGFKVKLRSK